MAAYEPTMSYRLIYIFAIHDKDHEGYKKYELTEDEIAFIESTIRVME